ncbi:hypothetical protein IW261DRAFT_1654084 [Armillaria novae-zelandiae]|uniref:Uncharacterized protein n=1 Tax=Armillaria novae-zelandiae TaxID=153914 RepID=A0AA39PNG8_9AGAR|nr:hypothetical protein IW261DRAFT_1654084 [Armillaria novae-zelandiae]
MTSESGASAPAEQPMRDVSIAGILGLARLLESQTIDLPFSIFLPEIPLAIMQLRSLARPEFYLAFEVRVDRNADVIDDDSFWDQPQNSPRRHLQEPGFADLPTRQDGFPSDAFASLFALCSADPVRLADHPDWPMDAAPVEYQRSVGVGVEFEGLAGFVVDAKDEATGVHGFEGDEASRRNAVWCRGAQCHCLDVRSCQVQLRGLA